MDLTDLTFSPHSIPTALTAVVVISLGLRASLRKNRSQIDSAFAIMTLPISIWLVGFSFMHSAATPETTLAWARLSYLGVPFIPVGAYQFAVTVLGVRPRRQGVLSIFWIAGALFSVVAVTTSLAISRLVHYRWGYYPQYDTVGSILFAFVIAVVLVTQTEYLRAHGASPPGAPDLLARWCGIGYFIACIALVDDAPKYGIDVYPFGYIPVLAFIVIAAWAMQRYRQ